MSGLHDFYEKNGGAAFPTAGVQGVPYFPGLTVRDYFAAQPVGDYEFPNIASMAEFMGEPVPEDDFSAMLLSAKCEARIRYMRADAMLAERDK